MCEIFLLIMLSKQLGEMVERNGHDSMLIRVLFIVSWIVAEVLGAAIGAAVAGFPTAVVGGIMGIFIVCVIFFGIAGVLPEKKRKSGYMDDYYEYRSTGRIKKKKADDYDDD